jgi:hypothetical protein
MVPGIDVEQLRLVFDDLAVLGRNRLAGPAAQVVRVERHALAGPCLMRGHVADAYARGPPVGVHAFRELQHAAVIGSGALVGDDHHVREAAGMQRAAHDVVPVGAARWSRGGRRVGRDRKHQRVAELLGHTSRDVPRHFDMVGDGHRAAARIDQRRPARRDGGVELGRRVVREEDRSRRRQCAGHERNEDRRQKQRGGGFHDS